MPKVFIQIGQHRTGTTTLQNFLAKNREVLYEKGIIYPEFLKPASSHFFAWYYGFGNRKLHTGDSEKVASIIQKTIRGALEHSRDIVISSEVLFSNISKSALRKIRKQFRNFDIKIICYLRRQDEYILSYYSQYLKHGNTMEINSYIDKQLFTWYHYLRKPQYEWYVRLKKYANVFGKDALVIVPFEISQLEGGDVVSDFLKHTGIDKKGLYFPDENYNASLPEEGIQLLRYLNSMMPANRHAKTEGQKSMPYVEILERYYVRHEHMQKPGITFSKRKAIVNLFDKGNQKIAREFLGRKDGILFMDSITDENEVHEPIDMDQQEILQLLVKILSDQHQEIKYLKRK